MEKVTVTALKQSKARGSKVSMLTAYDFSIAKILDEAGIDIVLVGDSLGNVALGYQNTLPVTMSEMIIHTQAVARGVKHALVVADMPFGSYQENDDRAVANAVQLVKAGAAAVKLEGPGYISAIKKIIKAGIPVMGHLGFTPQSVHLLGYKIQGRGAKDESRLIKESKELEKSGCFALVLELMPEELAAKITKMLKIPTIGIGAGEKTDGQVLVTNDLLGLYENPPSFARPRINLRKIIKDVVVDFVNRRPYRAN